jgi:hypothetical protein
MVNEALDQLPPSIWQMAVTQLQQDGIAVLELLTTNNNDNNNNNDDDGTKNSLLQNLFHPQAFATARRAMDVLTKNHHPAHNDDSDDDTKTITATMIPPNADSAHVTGFHTAGMLSMKYNTYREGFVFSDHDGKEIKDIISCTKHRHQEKEKEEEDMILLVHQFHVAQATMFASLHGMANRILTEIERQMELPYQWFQRHLGPTETSSQWHMKRYHNHNHHHHNNHNNQHHHHNVSSSTTTTNTKPTTEPIILLPMHTDPSIISVVVHDWSTYSPPSSTNNSSNSKTMMGLQYYDSKRTWKDVTYQGATHQNVLATVLVGSVLSHMTERIWPAVKHRVIQTTTTTTTIGGQQSQQRMAATLFVRPQLSALLPAPLPSPVVQQQIQLSPRISKQQQQQGQSPSPFQSYPDNTHIPPLPSMTFGTWLQRVAKNYQSNKNKSQNKQQQQY